MHGHKFHHDVGFVNLTTLQSVSLYHHIVWETFMPCSDMTWLNIDSFYFHDDDVKCKTHHIFVSCNTELSEYTHLPFICTLKKKLWPGLQSHIWTSLHHLNCLYVNRPTLKKNLARLVAPGPHNMPPPSSAQTSTYDPEFPSNKKSGGGANSYQFIPTQFRTQPVNLPTPLLPRGNTLASLQDRSKFSIKVFCKFHRKVNLFCIILWFSLHFH